MLILARRVNERIRIGNITVTVTSIGKHKVHLGIDAPPNVPILREELIGKNEPEKGNSPDG